MTITVTLDMYSGLQNPSWELSDNQVAQFLALMRKGRTRSMQKSAAAAGLLGYRGFVVNDSSDDSSLTSVRAFDGLVEPLASHLPSYVDSESEIEHFLLATGQAALTVDESLFVQGELQKNVSGGVADLLSDLLTTAAPPYEPGKWNNPTIQPKNNCYNYANNIITNTFAQPGRGSGQEGPYPPSCPGTGQAAQRDGEHAIPSPEITPAQGHIIALVVSTTPGFLDYHWYRRDANAMWSHKPGGTAVRNTDNSGRAISDPRTANRGPYNLFCGFYNCVPGQVRIR